jgi:aryl-alcohol dehydrogenase-like predicted oxidoreductase
VKLGLGTAQFGLDYGISNRSGRTQPDEVRNILALAAERGISHLDTAPGYGDSESILGECLPRDHGFLITTKIRPVREKVITGEHVTAIHRHFEESLVRLRQERIHAVLLHHSDDLLAEGGERLMQMLVQLRERGLIERIGVSLYDAQEFESLSERQYLFELLQVPISVFDQRLVQDGWIEKWTKSGVAVHARSIFLQGFLLMNAEDLPPHLRAYASVLRQFRCFARDNGCLPVHAALKYVDSLPGVQAAIVGVNTADQLQQLLEYPACQIDCTQLESFAQHDVKLLNPSLWRQ